MFESAKFSRISENIVEQIRQAVLRGDLKPGDRLPAEKDLAARFGVSKASLREAFRALETMGMLEVKQGMSGGAFVREVDLRTARDNFINYIFFQNPSVEDFTQLRLLYEPQLAQIAAEKICKQKLSFLEKNLEETRKKLDSTQGFSYDLDIEFHKTIAEASGNCLISLVIDTMQNALIHIKQLLQPDYEFSKQVYLAHNRIVEAIKGKDPARAADEMRCHILEVNVGLAAFTKDGNTHVLESSGQEQSSEQLVRSVEVENRNLLNT